MHKKCTLAVVELVSFAITENERIMLHMHITHELKRIYTDVH